MGFLNKLFGSSNRKDKQEPPQAASFNSSDDLMDESQFWEIIETTKTTGGDDYERQQQCLATELLRLHPNEIIQFANRFRYFRGMANSWDLCGAIYIINGGCGDDAFNDFREWVIAQGKDFFSRTISNPSSLINVEAEKIVETDWEGFGYVPAEVFKKLTGQEMPYPFKEDLDIKGEEWDEDGDDLQKRFPQLYAKYSGYL